MKQLIATLGTILLLGGAPALACCSLAPAKFWSTRGYAGEGTMNGKLVHVLGYQNAAQNLVADSGKGNAMLLPIPAVKGSMARNNIIDTSKLTNCLRDIEASIPRVVQKSFDGSEPRSIMGRPVPIVFDHDIYTIVLAQSAKDIPAALAQVPASKRPAMNPAIFAMYDKWYPGWTFALCCFNTKEGRNANPMVWWYEPKDPANLFFPTLDAHTGQPPNLNESVELDHAIAFGSTRRTLTEMFRGHVEYSDRIPKEYAGLFPNAVTGIRMNGSMKNGDFWLPVASLETDPKATRELPPGARK